MTLLDEPNEGWPLGIPIASCRNAAQNLPTAKLGRDVARVQHAVADRLRNDGLRPVSWDDLIAN